MRKLLWVLITLSALWSGYWFVGSSAVRNGAEQWFADQAAQGMTAENTGLSVSGFPNRFDLTVEGIRFADPKTGIGWEAPFAQVFAMTWKPWHIIAALPPEQTIRLPDQDIGLTSTGLRASARARPSLSVPLQEVVVEGTALKATSTQGWTLGMGSLVFAIRADNSQTADNNQTGDNNQTAAYDIGLNALALAPDAAFLAAVQAQSDLPPDVEVIRADLTARLSAPLDRMAGETRPTLTGLDVKEALVTWGALSILAKGQIEPDAGGFASGRVEIEVTNWQRLIPLLIVTGAVKPEVAPTVENMMAAMAKQGGTPDVLKLPLTLASGRMSLGPLPLGPAPMLLPPTN